MFKNKYVYTKKMCQTEELSLWAQNCQGNINFAWGTIFTQINWADHALSELFLTENASRYSDFLLFKT